VHFHFTPTIAAWFDQGESRCSILPEKALPGAFVRSVVPVKDHIDAFIGYYSQGTAPFIWTKTRLRRRRFKHWRNSKL
jgi:hypothetical protein